MNITFSYKVDSMKKAASLNGLTDVVTKVSFTYSGEAEDGTKIEWPLIDISVPEPTSESFTPLDQLTEAEVIAWVEACYPIGPVTAAITQQIEDIVNPKEEVTELPWAAE